jgi:hypothetical protein
MLKEKIEQFIDVCEAIFSKSLVNDGLTKEFTVTAWEHIFNNCSEELFELGAKIAILNMENSLYPPSPKDLFISINSIREKVNEEDVKNVGGTE